MFLDSFQRSRYLNVPKSDLYSFSKKVTKRNGSGDDTETPRTITQYHYLNWKDFMAPEHPYGIIKFIRTINSVYSVQRGPILVHCSAGKALTLAYPCFS